ncbi:MAG: hypothetical protein Q7S40_08115 [Opitutaceae bacterium]|nr:hypothetical protein [Opitutaceae bacterium]
MKAFTTALLAAAGLAISSARADHDSRVIVSGHVHLGAPAPVYAAPAYYPPPPVHYVPTRGYWKDMVVKTWVPERWSVSHNRWGRPVRTCEPGYFAYRTERVWVDGRDGYGHGNNRYGQANDYRGGYGYRR